MISTVAQDRQLSSSGGDLVDDDYSRKVLSFEMTKLPVPILILTLADFSRPVSSADNGGRHSYSHLAVLQQYTQAQHELLDVSFRWTDER